MEHIIIRETIRIDNVNYGDFLNVTGVNGNTVSVNISNNESMTYDIKVVNNDVETSVNDFFAMLGDGSANIY